jgi:hypothetical protein
MLVYGTCEKCGRERVPGKKVYSPHNLDEHAFKANGHRALKSPGWGWQAWCFQGTLKDIERRGTVARPLPAHELNLRKLDDEQLQALFERVEREMVRRAESSPVD